jgi:hypothetical protein
VYYSILRKKHPLIRSVLLLLCLTCAACAERPVFGVELGSQKIQDCVPGSVSRPCN